MFNESTPVPSRDKIGDWVLRVGIGLVFALFGREKFTDPMWVSFFDQVGVGQWFRDFTGVVEMAGAALVLFPKTTRIGALILAITMVVASLIHVIVLRHPANVIITGLLCVGLFAFSLRMRRAEA
jgi:putative oxidoreductase